MSGLPIRVRLTAWYVLLLAAIIVGLGVFLVRQLGADLQESTDRQLLESSAPIARGYAEEGPEDFIDASATALPADAIAQIVAPNGELLHTYGALGRRRPLADRAVIAQVLAGRRPTYTVKDRRLPEDYRVIARPVMRDNDQRILVVGQSLEEAEEPVEQMLALLLLAGPAALAATALGGWLLARKALRPVDRMTSKAAEIGIDRLDERIAVPQANDEVGHLAVTLNAMLERLESGVQDKRRLIADASHELRTPLAVMRAELDVSLRGDALSPGSREVLESVREEVDRMSRTVDNLLTLAQVDEGRLKLLTAKVDMHDAVVAAVAPLRPLAAAKGVRLDADGEMSATRADPQRVHQALTNFIENAIKFTPQGGEVRVASWRGRGEVGVTITDNGPGLAAEARRHVFDRFYRVDSSRGREGGGSGLGLAICREVATAHGGRVWVESEEGKGSEFSLALPAVD